MNRSRPAQTGYERLAQADQFSDESDDELLGQSSASLQPASAPRFAPISQPRGQSGMISPRSTTSRPKFRQRVGSNAAVDIKAINARLERWADEIASRFKRGKGKHTLSEDEPLEIHHSVFQAPEGVKPITAEELGGPQTGVMTKAEFDVIVESVRTAIGQQVHPSMISQGSSGSYFARDPDGKIVGVFKPKDEEPYAAGNPKWNKWIHRNLFPCFFGRAWYVFFLLIYKHSDFVCLSSSLLTPELSQLDPQSFLRERSRSLRSRLPTPNASRPLYRRRMAIIQIVPLPLLGSKILQDEKEPTSKARQLPGVLEGIQGCQCLLARAPLARSVLVRIPRQRLVASQQEEEAVDRELQTFRRRSSGG